MTSLTLLVFILFVWGLLLVAGAMEVAVVSRELPLSKRGRVGTIRVMPIFPFALWGLALLADAVASPFGTNIVCALHIFLGVVAIVCIVRCSFALVIGVANSQR
jgi:hypothetical protein